MRTLVATPDPPRRPEQRAARPPLDSVREAPFKLRAADDGEPNDGYTLDGFGAIFNTETVIDSWEGRFREKIAPGSMRRSFRETPPKIQFDHGRHPMIGSIPIAELRSISEDTDPVLAPQGGAHVVGRVFDNWLMAPVRDAIAAGAIDGMSFRFSVVRESWERPDGKSIKNEDELMAELMRTCYEDVSDEELLVRTLKELKVPEIGPVTWPAYEATSVSVRSVIDLGRIQERDPEQLKLLASAVFLADLAENDDSQRSTPVVGERQSTTESTESDEQQDAAPEAELPSPKEDAQRSTDLPAVGEHPSKPRWLSNKDLRLRNQRDRLLNLRAIGERSA